jgi:hypothetical protein
MSKQKKNTNGSNRRQFFSKIAVAGATAATVGGAELLAPQPLQAAIANINDETVRKNAAADMRTRLARYYADLPLAPHLTNGDEERYPTKINTFSKTLRHNDLGEVNAASYSSFRKATDSGDTKDYDAILMGGPVRLKTPQASHSFTCVGADAAQFSIPPAPRFDSAWQAGEMIELYWMSLLRDVPFAEYATNPMVARACAELSRVADFRGPKVGGRVTPATLFRGFTAGDVQGPMVSQFLLKQVNQRPIVFDQKSRVFKKGVDYATTTADWLALQSGITKGVAPQYEEGTSYIKSLRDLANYVWQDVSYLPYLNALMILLDMGTAVHNWQMFYLHNQTQEGYINFGPPDATFWIGQAAKNPYLAAWYQKYQVHRRARPEVAAGRLHNHLNQRVVYPIHNDLLTSEAVQLSAQKFGTYYLPQAFPEGSPPHSSYPSGHATGGGYFATILKQLVQDTMPFPDPVDVSADGQRLVTYTGPALTIGGELNKLASNIATGRNAAGIHFRTDMEEGMKLGEQVAMHALRDIASTYTEDFGGFPFTRLNGQRAILCATCAAPA